MCFCIFWRNRLRRFFRGTSSDAAASALRREDLEVGSEAVPEVHGAGNANDRAVKFELNAMILRNVRQLKPISAGRLRQAVMRLNGEGNETDLVLLL
uniref:Uncharacterized protein n=1 Tax=Chromera velia CCMP2878 TaxID=1169474 RepID=A0A0G4HQ32_9ALVE|eukprot:Cvel_7865.t1-p1 / transcript=Cvel_7865.t1 / gene=Cvel_7865 / organism=Chromera_velia_CCMP2878 / gene_product=hypothetical protein / transcript_product=hypothetical protein / location=Cvel_scaffold421:51000-51287(-) / protein_length=96 / sequence_SO=supercontig / SO=protein_coding / is_pseudo=false